MDDKTRHNLDSPALAIGDRVRVSDNPGCMTHSGAAVGLVGEVFSGKTAEVVSAQEYGDYRVRIGPGPEETAWIATIHLSPIT